MSRYIDANKLEESIRKLRRCLQLMDNSKRADIVMQGISLAEIEIEKIPAADVAPVVHGEWKPVEDSDCWRGFLCSRCGKAVNQRENYCPNCSADMRGKNETSL